MGDNQVKKRGRAREKGVGSSQAKGQRKYLGHGRREERNDPL
jgi:hypothetical protein